MKFKPILNRLLLSLATAYLFAMGYLYFNQSALVYHPIKDIGPIEIYGLQEGTEEVFLTSSDGTKIQTWYHMPFPNMPTIVYFTGNAGNLSGRVDRYKDLIDMGYGLVAISYRGFGKSGGTMSKEGIYDDARAGIKFAISLGIQTKDIILIGESLGTGISVKMATEFVDVKGVLLMTPYTTIADVGQEKYWIFPTKWLVNDNFNSIDIIQDVKAPIMIIHGDKDTVIPYTHSLKLIDKVTSEKKIIIYPGVNHTDYDFHAVIVEMSNFLKVDIKNHHDQKPD